MPNLGFLLTHYMDQVETAMEEIFGITQYDLPDLDYIEMMQTGFTPIDTAAEIVRSLES